MNDHNNNNSELTKKKINGHKIITAEFYCRKYASIKRKVMGLIESENYQVVIVINAMLLLEHYFFMISTLIWEFGSPLVAFDVHLGVLSLC